MIFRNKKAAAADLLGDALKVMSSSIDVDFDFGAYARRHIFNKLSASSEYGFYYYPYGYLFRYPKWGTINEMGFRFGENFPEARRKYADHFRIAFYGGSTGFDILVPDADTICAKLERKLNGSEAVRGVLGRPVKIFNLSQPGNLVINQLINHVVFGSQLQPHMVISHNAVNDFASHQTNDPNLVSNYALGYPDVLEAWGRKVHDAHDVDIDYLHADPQRDDFVPAQPRTGPDAVLGAYHTRLRQFCRLCEDAGIAFVNGFQPWVTSKRSLSADEQRRLREYNPFYRDVYQNVPELYSKYRSDFLTRDPIGILADLESHFRDLDGSVTHFGDVCHLYEPGDEECAGVYFEAVRRHLCATNGE